MPKLERLNCYQRLRGYFYLCRLNNPIGTELVLWPTLWALWIANQGIPPLRVLIPMLLGVLFMRAAGCAINDFADRKVDGHVRRTQNRPLATGIIKPIEAILVFVILLLASASLLFFLPIACFYWAWGALALAFIYPFMKRFTHLPQVFLGAAFSWSIPIAYAAVGQIPDLSCWLLFFANLAWTVAYDTQYAMSDRPDDIKIGIKSTAILFGRFDVAIICLLQLLSLILLHWVVLREGLIPWTSIALFVVALDFVYQAWRIRHRDPQQCLATFKHNRWVGLIIWVGIAIAYL